MSYVLKVCVIGDGAVGKTSLIIRYTEGHFRESYLMTVGTSFAVKSLDLDGTQVKLQLWDLAGQPHFSSVRPVFYRGSVGGIMVYDVTRRETFNNIHTWFNEFTQVTGVLPFALVANKTDLVDQRQVSKEEGEAYSQKNGWDYFETSAKEGRGVTEAFRLIAQQVIGKSR